MTITTYEDAQKYLGINQDEFAQLDPAKRAMLFLKAVNEERRNLRRKTK